MATASQKELHITVFGHVQGVGFRVFVASHAQKSGVRGFVQNNADGSVTIVVQGQKELLEQLLLQIKKESFFARITQVQADWHEPAAVLQGFEIRQTTF